MFGLQNKCVIVVVFAFTFSILKYPFYFDNLK